MPVKVLVCSPNQDLAMLRAAVLRTAGCEVVTPVSQSDSIQLMREEHFDVLIICYEYSEEAGEEICDAFKKINPGGRIIVMKKAHKQPACDDVDGAVFSLDGPGALIKAVLAA